MKEQKKQGSGKMPRQAQHNEKSGKEKQSQQEQGQQEQGGRKQQPQNLQNPRYSPGKQGR